MWSPARVAALAVLGCLAVGGCSSDPDTASKRPTPTVFTAKGVSCDHDKVSDDAKNTVEEVGGLASKDYVVRFSESTPVGVVALVRGDTQKAFDELSEKYGVAIVAKIEDDGTDKVTGFQQVRDLVDAACD